MNLIKKIIAREILDSRGNPTIEVDLITKYGLSRASTPSGISTGKYEAFELRDKDKRYNGLGVQKAVKNINQIIAKELIGEDVTKQEHIDKLLIKLDGTQDKSNLGANAILAVSIAICKAGALSKNVSLYNYISKLINRKPSMPIPSMNIINGGKHAGSDLDFQEYMIVPKARKFSDTLRISSEIYQSLKKIIEKKYGKSAINVGDEGGFAPPLKRIEEPFDLILKATKLLGYEKNIRLAIDCAASEFFKNNMYYLEKKKISREKLLNIYEDLIKRYPIISIEDPFHQDDYEGFSLLNNKKIQVVGDDLLATNIKRIKTAIAKNSCNALLLKINQVGTIYEAIEAAKLCFKNNWNVIVSHRSGETEDSFIADLAVGIGCNQIKAGAPCRGERLAKYNQLLRIEEELR